MSLVLVTLVGGSLLWLVWQVVRLYVVRSCIDHIPGPARSSFLLGHFGEIMSPHAWDWLDKMIREYPTTMKLESLLGEKILYTSDPIAMHDILVKDHLSFEESDEFIVGNNLLFGPGLVSTVGEIHRKQRKILGPAFSTAHLRTITPLFVQIAETLKDAIAQQVKSGVKSVDMLNWMSRTALEVIGRGGLGESFDPLVTSTKNEYGDAIKNTLPTVFKLAAPWFFISWAPRLGPPQFRRWLLDIYPNQTVQELKRIVDYTYGLAIDLVKRKKAALEKGEAEGVGEGKDIISMLLKANMVASVEDRLPDDQLVGQVNTMVFAATDTTSNSLARTLHVLTEHPDAQDRLRQEILKTRAELGGNELSYDKLMDLPWLDAVCRESLRVYPPVLFLDRVVQKDTVLPLGTHLRDIHGNMIHKIPLTKGTMVTLNLYGYNRSKEIWGEDATEWKPERWMSPLPESTKAVPGGTTYANLMTFSVGNRACIGFKYAELEMKIILFHLFESFKFLPTEETIHWISSHIVYPSITKENPEAKMPVKLELL